MLGVMIIQSCMPKEASEIGTEPRNPTGSMTGYAICLVALFDINNPKLAIEDLILKWMT